MKGTFKKIGIVGFKDKSADLACALNQIALWAVAHPQVKFFALDSLSGLVQKPIRVVKEPGLRNMDLLLAIGGDGTVLSAAHIALGHNIPILGVNAGRVGFLAESRVEGLSKTLDDLIAGDFSTRDRMMIDASVYCGKKCVAKQTVLNEVHIRAHAPDRMVNVNVATPAVVLTPVAPSSLSVRPLVLSLTDKKLQIASAVDRPLDLVFDGRITVEMKSGYQVTLGESKSVTTFIRMRHTGFVGALREKLGWTGKPRLA